MAGGPVVVQATPTSWVEGTFDQEGVGLMAALKFKTVNGSSELEEVQTGLELKKPPPHTRSDEAYLTVPIQGRLQNSDQPLMDYEERKDLFEVRREVKQSAGGRRAAGTCSHPKSNLCATPPVSVHPFVKVFPQDYHKSLKAAAGLDPPKRKGSNDTTTSAVTAGTKASRSSLSNPAIKCPYGCPPNCPHVRNMTQERLIDKSLPVIAHAPPSKRTWRPGQGYVQPNRGYSLKKSDKAGHSIKPLKYSDVRGKKKEFFVIGGRYDKAGGWHGPRAKF